MTTGERILVLMPTEKDGERTRKALAGAGLECAVYKDLAALCRGIERGAGLALLTEEAIAGDREGCLRQALRAQPAWSDFPLVVLAREGSEGMGFRELMNATLVERPVKFRSLLSVVRAALRSRRHQYAIRDLLAERVRQEQELREADRRKDEFLAMLGHELRNPLAPLRSVAEVLRRQKPDGGARERAYAMMERQVGHLSRLVDDLLDVARVSRGLVELRREPVDMAAVADHAIEMAAPAVEGRGHELSLALPRKPLWVEGDADRLTQVLFNLLNNAAKYTDAGGRIWLTVERQGGQAMVRVRDNGSGMNADLVPRVFDLFTQGDRTPNRSQGGLGLGLALVKRLVEMHGGSVQARSEGPGKGSEFTVRLPALAAGAEKPPPAPAPGRPPVAVQVGRALVIDDNFDVAESVTWILEGLAREIRMAHSGPAALEMAPEFKPDVIICDIGMPGMDGYETCRRLRRLPGLDKAMIAAVSGYGGPEDRKKSQEAGFDRHLVKPVGRATLEELVKSATGA